MKLIILPNLLYKKGSLELFPFSIKEKVKRLDSLIAESRKEAFVYLSRFLKREEFEKINIFLLNEHTSNNEIRDIFKGILKGKTFGMISDCGMPAISDPGAKLIFLCRENKVKVEAILGPSSIFLAFILSGFPSKGFCFNGYLPIKEFKRKKAIKELEKISYEKDLSQIFIETPYRSQKVFEVLLKTLKKDTYLSIAKELTSPLEEVFSKKVSKWKKEEIYLHKKEVVFTIYAKKIII